MKKIDLINAVAARVEANKSQTANIINATIETIKETLANGEEVKLTGFLDFKIVDVAERKARNVKTGEPIVVPPHKSVKAKLAKSIKDCLR